MRNKEEIEGPVKALLGTVDTQGHMTEYKWADAVTENPSVGATELWDLQHDSRCSPDAHHEVVFEVVNREALVLHEGGGDRSPGSECILRPLARSCGTATSSSTRTTR